MKQLYAIALFGLFSFAIAMEQKTYAISFSEEKSLAPCDTSLLELSKRRMLVLYRAGVAKGFKFRQDDAIWIRLKDDKHWHFGRIDALGPDYIYLKGTRIPLSEIAGVEVPPSTKYPGIGRLFVSNLPGAGVLFFLVDLFQVIAGKAPFSPQYALICLGVVVLGFLLSRLIRQRFRVNGKSRWLGIIELPETLEKRKR